MNILKFLARLVRVKRPARKDAVGEQLKLASSLSTSGRHKEARQLLDALQSADSDVRYLYLSAVVFSRMKEYERAIYDLERLLAISPSNIKALNLTKKIKEKEQENRELQRLASARQAIEDWNLTKALTIAESLLPSKKRSLLLAEIAILRGEAEIARRFAHEALGSSTEAPRAISILTLLEYPTEHLSTNIYSAPFDLPALLAKDQIRWMPVLFNEGRLDEIILLTITILGDPKQKAAAPAATTWHFRALEALGQSETIVALASTDDRYSTAACRPICIAALLQLGRTEEAYSLVDKSKSNVAGDVVRDGFHVTIRRNGVAAAYSMYRDSHTAKGLRTAFPDTYLSDHESLCATKGAILVADGGVGDEIRHAAIYAKLEASAADLTITCDPRLHSILSRSFPRLDFLPVSRWRRETSFGQYHGRSTIGGNIHCARQLDDAAWSRLESAPAVGSVASLITSVWPEDVMFKRARMPHVVPDLSIVNALQTRLKMYGGEQGPRCFIGISWRSTLRSTARDSHYTDIQEWDNVLRVPGVTFVNLQAKLASDERDYIRATGADFIEIDELDLMDDFEGMAALMKSLDVVVAPATTMIELAGAVGAPALFLANGYKTAWRLKDDGRDVWHDSIEPVVPDPLGRNDIMLGMLRNRLEAISHQHAAAIGIGFSN